MQQLLAQGGSSVLVPARSGAWSEVIRGCAVLRSFATDGGRAGDGDGTKRTRRRGPSSSSSSSSPAFSRPAYSKRQQRGEDDDAGRPNAGQRTIQRVVPMSRPLRALYDACVKGDSKALAKYKEQFEKKERFSEEEMELLADTLEFYFSMAPAAATSVDGVRVADRNALRALYKIARAYSGSKGRDAAIPEGMPISSPVEKTVVNTAPLGRLPWQVLGVNEEKATVWWGVDLTGGKSKDPWSNGRLSQAAKDAMYRAHVADPERYTTARLAEIFRVREQRAMAIIRLKEMEEKERREKRDGRQGDRVEEGGGDGGDGGGQDGGSPAIGAEAVRVMERALQCTQGIGANERHHVELPSFPAYADVDGDDVVAALEQVLQKKIADIAVEDITADVAARVLGTKSLREMEDVVAEREERHLVEEFKERLDFNLGVTGQTISRDSRRTKAVRRPKEGWSLLVTPIGKDSKAKHERFVALPDGTRRGLTADEQLYVERKAPRRRRKIL